MTKNLLALCGALIGGILGYLAFFWIAAQGFYGLALPGGLLGLGAGVVRNRSIGVSVICGLSATALGLFTESRFAPFRDDPSLGYFLAHVSQLQPVTLLMIGVGGLIGFYVPFRRREKQAVPLA
jgi:hypothetical protein